MTPTAVDTQRMAALRRAQMGRARRAALRRDLKTKTVSLEQVLSDPPDLATPVQTILRSCWSIGPVKAPRALRKMGIPENRRLCDLSQLEATMLIAYLRRNHAAALGEGVR